MSPRTRTLPPTSVEYPVHGHGSPAPPSMDPGGRARDEASLDRTQVEPAGDRVVQPLQLFAQRQIVAAVGGMVVPALIDTGFDFHGAGAAGWGNPVTIDI